MNVTDDLEYLMDSKYFSEKCNKLFTVTAQTEKTNVANTCSRGNKLKLDISAKSHNISVITLDAEEIELGETETETETETEIDRESSNEELVYEKAEEEVDDDSESQDDDTSSDSEEYCDSQEEQESEADEEWTDCSSEEYETEKEEFAYIRNYPVQLICLEKCEGTLDRLFIKKEMNLETSASAMMQVIMTLLVFQKCFRFTHNDLHTNNIMYNSTNIEYLYYRANGKVYKVPTYGKLFKIIDFGRGIYQFQGKQFCSDSFADNGDAATQYNCEPYMNEKKPRIDPNYSFDLCRLGCSIYDFIIESEDTDTMDEFQKTVYRWCLDDNDKNVLYKRNGDDRYPNFRLYKMIARTVHNHTPENQLDFLFFNQFLFNDEIPKESIVMDIDALPVYV
jgi:hypothetical protein